MRQALASALLLVALVACTNDDEGDSAVQAACSANTCGAGSYCADEGVCKSIQRECAQPNTCTCQVIDMTGQLPVDDSLVGQVVPAGAAWQPEVVLNTPQRAFPQTDFSLTVEGPSAASFAVQGTQISATPVAGHATLVVQVGPQVLCRAPLTNLGPAPQSGLRFYVFDQSSGLPLAGAQLIVQPADGTPQRACSSDGQGVALSPEDLSGAFAVSVFAANHQYLTVAGLQASAGADVALPVAPQQVARGGFSGRVDYADFEDATSGLPLPVRFGLAGASLPMDGLLQFNLTGNIMQGGITNMMGECDPNVPGCYAMSMRDGKKNVPLPAPLQLQAGLPVKTAFDVRARAGQLMPFVLGGELRTPVAEALPALGMAAYGGKPGKVAELVQSMTDLLPQFGAGTHAPVALPAIDAKFWADQTGIKDLNGRPAYPGLPVLDKGKRGQLRLQSPMAQWTNVEMADFSVEDQLDVAILATGVNARGFGFVPLGLGVGFDSVGDEVLNGIAPDKDGKVHGVLACGSGACAGSPPTQLADGHLPLFYAQPMGGLEAHPQLTLILGISITETVAQLDTQLLVGRVVPGPPTAANLARQPWMVAPLPGTLDGNRVYTWTSPSAAHLHRLRFTLDGGAEWHVFVAGDSTELTLPAVPAGWADLSQEPTVTHIALQTDGTTLDQMAHRHTLGLSNFAESVRAFALRSQTFFAN